MIAGPNSRKVEIKQWFYVLRGKVSFEAVGDFMLLPNTTIDRGEVIIGDVGGPVLLNRELQVLSGKLQIGFVDGDFTITGSVICRQSTISIAGINGSFLIDGSVDMVQCQFTVGPVSVNAVISGSVVADRSLLRFDHIFKVFELHQFLNFFHTSTFRAKAGQTNFNDSITFTDSIFDLTVTDFERELIFDLVLTRSTFDVIHNANFITFPKAIVSGISTKNSIVTIQNSGIGLDFVLYEGDLTCTHSRISIDLIATNHDAKGFKLQNCNYLVSKIGNNSNFESNIEAVQSSVVLEDIAQNLNLPGFLNFVQSSTFRAKAGQANFNDSITFTDSIFDLTVTDCERELIFDLVLTRSTFDVIHNANFITFPKAIVTGISTKNSIVTIQNSGIGLDFVLYEGDLTCTHSRISIDLIATNHDAKGFKLQNCNYLVSKIGNNSNFESNIEAVQSSVVLEDIAQNLNLPGFVNFVQSSTFRAKAGQANFNDSITFTDSIFDLTVTDFERELIFDLVLTRSTFDVIHNANFITFPKAIVTGISTKNSIVTIQNSGIGLDFVLYEGDLTCTHSRISIDLIATNHDAKGFKLQNCNYLVSKIGNNSNFESNIEAVQSSVIFEFVYNFVTVDQSIILTESSNLEVNAKCFSVDRLVSYDSNVFLTIRSPLCRLELDAEIVRGGIDIHHNSSLITFPIITIDDVIITIINDGNDPNDGVVFADDFNCLNSSIFINLINSNFNASSFLYSIVSLKFQKLVTMRHFSVTFPPSIHLFFFLMLGMSCFSKIWFF
ncbi:hypothetical protein GEMRC1_003204 [Eukaryota sp. GEM-RC1]